MSGSANNPLAKVVGRVFPKVADFYALLAKQSAVAVEATEALMEFLETGDKEAGKRVLELEKEGDTLKDDNLDTLNQAFSTPMDREDLYRAMTTIDHIINYCKTTVREMQVLQVEPDDIIREMGGYLRDGAASLDAGYRVLSTAPAGAEAHAQAARKAERNTEKAYRRGLSELFDVERHASSDLTGAQALGIVMETFKRREVYRHMSNGSDRVARAGEVLRDIVVKLV